MHLDTLGEETSSIFLLNTRNHHAASTSLPVNRRGHLASGGKLAITRRISSKFRPVVAGYRRDSFSLLSGPMMNTALQVRGMPLASFSSGSIIPYRVATSLLGSAMMG